MTEKDYFRIKILILKKLNYLKVELKLKKKKNF